MYIGNPQVQLVKKLPTTISNFPTLAVVTFSAGGNPRLACKASPFISTKLEKNKQNSQ